MGTYKIIRHFQREQADGRIKRVIKTGLTLEQAQAHCSDPETSSSKAKRDVNVARTVKFGDWFDGYTEE